ncbi:MAG: hypothetical protein C0601_04560 [Candidatus Muiribacterium halophilum]|uniref:RDD domain-containing protein n=1 Tax=Muiribacterium halophilum TaxID=2053465 RepID=A0A2N5ZII3_MUIH1|nr:MAG: hypothetical protein C0601_04560 [Candidatus Muirbacterium halophilum]
MNCPKCGDVFEEGLYSCPSCGDYFPKPEKVEFKKRIIAAIIDMVIVSILVFMGLITGVLATVYMLFRDNLTKKGSLGKLLMGINIIDINKKTRAAVNQRIGRNFFAAVLLLLFVFFRNIILINYIVAGVLAIYAAAEFYYIYSDEKGQRLSDKLSRTILV